MTARRRVLGGVAAALLLTATRAHADIALFGAYWDNVARAAAQNDAAKVRSLLSEGNSPNQVDDEGRSGLEIAALNGNLQIAAILIKAGANANQHDRLGNTALHYAVERDHVEMAELLLDVGAKVGSQNRNGLTALMLAAGHGDGEIVRALLAKGANPRQTDFTGRDAIDWAVDNRHSAIAAMLRQAAAKR